MSENLLVIRADADGIIGSGHVMRGLALAQAWREQGGEVVFLGRIGSEYLRRRIIGEGCALHPLATSHPDPQNLTEVVAWLHERRAQAGWLVLDGYHFDTAYHDAIRDSGWSLLVIDDYNHLPEYHADILLNPNAYAEELTYRTQPDTLRLMGSRYTPLRREFREAAEQQREVAARGRLILVTMGGADHNNVSGRVVDALLAMPRNDLAVKIVIGPLNPHRAVLDARLAGAPFAVELLEPVSEMAPLMQWADLAISAAGSTCWELAALGVPMLVTVLADNQERVAASLEGHGAAVNLGWSLSWQPERLAMLIAELLADKERRRHMGERGQSLVDGRGCQRLTQTMHSFHFVLRPAVAEDCPLVYQWANDPETRAVSFSRAPIAWDEHCRWFAERLSDPAHIFLIAVNGVGKPLGQVRFAVTDREAVISVSLDKNLRGAGLGVRLIRQASRQVMTTQGLTRILAHIRPKNRHSIQAFAKAGFRQTEGVCSHAGQAAVIMEYL